MGYIRLDEQPGEVYHYTHRKNLDSILRDGRIRRMGDRECWFCASLEDTLTLMRATVMMEGKPYYKVGGSIGRYPKFVPEDYVILRLNPRFQKGEWVQWMQEMPPGSPPELLKAAETFSNLKLGFRVDARSFLGLFALDYSKPLKVITDSLYAMRMLEIQQRNRAAHMARA